MAVIFGCSLCSGAFQTFRTHPTVSNTFYFATQHSHACIWVYTHLCTGVNKHMSIIHISKAKFPKPNSAYCYFPQCMLISSLLSYPTLHYSTRIISFFLSFFKCWNQLSKLISQTTAGSQAISWKHCSRSCHLPLVPSKCCWWVSRLNFCLSSLGCPGQLVRASSICFTSPRKAHPITGLLPEGLK